MLLVRIISFPLVPVYRIIIAVRNYLFDSGFFKIKKVGARIISVGNLTTGGSGKTPAVIYLINLLKNSGEKVGVLSRGYGRTSKGYHLVSDGRDIKCSPEVCGDEIYLTALECKVPAAVSERRVEGAEKLLQQQTELNFLVLDDAFQHRWLHRDFDLLLMDQQFLNKPGGMDQNLLPLGTMREPFSSLKRADAIIINRKFSGLSSIPVQLKNRFEGKEFFTAYYHASGIYDVKDQKFYNMDEFQGQKSLVVSGIARPSSFLNILNQNSIDTSNKLIFRDHKRYSHKEIQKIRKEFYSTNSHSVITTEKDAVKLTDYSKELDDIDIFYLKIEFRLDQEENFKNFFFEKLKRYAN